MKILPCPFCGAEPMTFSGRREGSEPRYYCPSCLGVEMHADRWNSRALLPAPPTNATPPESGSATRLDHRAVIRAAWLRGSTGVSWDDTKAALVPAQPDGPATLEDAVAICDRIQNEGKQMSESLKEYRRGWIDAAGECCACIRALIPGEEASGGEGP